MRIKKLTIGDNTYTDNVSIKKNLHDNHIHWLDNAEIENAILEIKDEKLYWLGGTWYYGDWEYGIWLDGSFLWGNWMNGVFYDGLFKNGTWYDGIFIKGTIEGGKFFKGDFRNPVVKGGDFSDNISLKENVITFINFKK